jgi:hypothetical protein
MVFGSEILQFALDLMTVIGPLEILYMEYEPNFEAGIRSGHTHR